MGGTPIVPMTYAAILEAYGWERFAVDAAAHGATSLIVSDVPAGRRPELRRIHLVAPTSTDERIRLAASTTDGWLYLVTLTGTTGARTELSSALEGLVDRTRALAGDLPLYAGFGISTPEQAAAAAALADGVVVGSRAVEAAEGGPSALGRVRRVAPRRARCPQWLTRTRLPQREQRARRCVRKKRFPSGTRWPRTRQRYRLTVRAPGRRGRASSRHSRRRACR